jgi:hypothetical protein
MQNILEWCTTKSKLTYMSIEMSILQFLKTASLNNKRNIVLSYKAAMSVTAFHQAPMIIKGHIRCWPSKKQGD